MASTTGKSLSTLYGPRSTSLPASRPAIQNVSVSPATRTRATSYPYDAGSTGRRAYGWQPSRLGPTTNLWGSLDLMAARSRDAVRNNPYAASAADNFESQVIGNGIRPRWNVEDPNLKLRIEQEFTRWAKSTAVDSAGLLSFWGLQALAAREIFERGEVFTRFHVRPSSWKMRIPLQLQLLEGEQIPVWVNTLYGGGSFGAVGTPKENSIRTGIEFDPSGRRIAYHMYRENPGETMFFPMEGLTFIRVPATEVLHVYKPYRAGQLRGQPMLTSTLALLYELEQYTDAALVKKKIQTMFAAFIEKTDPNQDIIPANLSDPNVEGDNWTNPQFSNNPEQQNSLIQTGTMQILYPGESVKFPQLPSENDTESFLRIQLHKLAVGVGATYEQITGDLKGVNYSSIRAGLLDFRRKCEQFQLNVIVAQLCVPIVIRWMKEAVLAGVLSLPGYANDPSVYEDITWSLPAWPWVDPLKDVQASQMAVRNGFTSREAVVAEQGEDVAVIDAQTAAANERADEMGLVHDSDPRKVLIGRESNPTEEPPEETEEGKKETVEEQKAS